MAIKDHVLVIKYNRLGTIPVRTTFQDAVITDLKALTDIMNLGFVTNASLYIPVTNEYGDPIPRSFYRENPIPQIDTHYFRPSCLDYDR